MNGGDVVLARHPSKVKLKYASSQSGTEGLDNTLSTSFVPVLQVAQRA